MGRVVHFEIAADDVTRAKKFYEIFGINITDSGMPGEYLLAKTGKNGIGIDGVIMPRSYSPKQAIRNTISVDDIDEMIKKVELAGGKITGNKDIIKGVGYYINATDTEGNNLGILQPL